MDHGGQKVSNRPRGRLQAKNMQADLMEGEDSDDEYQHPGEKTAELVGWMDDLVVPKKLSSFGEK